MQIIGIKRSRELIKYAMEHRLSIEEMTQAFAKESHQIKAGPGSGCFFTQENIHGSGRPNTPARPGSAWTSASRKESSATISAARSRPAISI